MTRKSSLGVAAKRATASARPGWLETRSSGPPRGTFLLALDGGVAGEPFQRPRASRPQAGLADYCVVGQDLARQSPGRYARDRFHYRAPAARFAQAEGGDKIVHT